MDWPAIAALAGVTIAMTTVFAFLWKINNDLRDRTDSLRDKTEGLRNDIAWINEDVAKVKTEVEWLVWFFKENRK